MSEQAPGLAEILGHFSYDLPWIVALVAPATLYGWAYLRLRTTRPRVPFAPWKPAAFAGGLVCVALALFSPIEHYGNQLLWVNFLGFLVLTMVGAPLIVASSPLTLAMRVMRPPARRRLRRVVRSPAASLLTFPPLCWLAFAVVTYVWQFGSPTERAAENVYWRDLQLATLLLVSLLFWIPALHSDPFRWRMAHPLRALYLVVEMTHKALFGAFFLSLDEPIHRGFAANAPAYAPSPVTDQTSAIVILWLGGNLVFMAVILGLAYRWVRYDTRRGQRLDVRMAAARERARRRREALEQVFEKGV